MILVLLHLKSIYLSLFPEIRIYIRLRLTECLCVCVFNVFVIICTCIKLFFVSLYSVYLCLNGTALINETTKTTVSPSDSTHITQGILSVQTAWVLVDLHPWCWKQIFQQHIWLKYQTFMANSGYGSQDVYKIFFNTSHRSAQKICDEQVLMCV